MIKNFLIALAVVILIGLCTGIYVWKFVWNKPHPTVENAENIIKVHARELAKEYNANEKASDAKYLNKVIEVSGTIIEMEKNQDGGLMVILQTDDPAAGIQCAMREKGLKVSLGHITIKGFCSGNGITGVSLTDCVIK